MKWKGLIDPVMTAIVCEALSQPAHAFRAEAYRCSDAVDGGEGQNFASRSEDCIFPRFGQYGPNSSSANLATGQLKTTVARFGGPIPGGGGFLVDTLTIQGPFSPMRAFIRC
jgi:hypothetical protein